DRRSDGHTIRMEGYVYIQNGPQKQLVRNKMTYLLAIYIMNMIIASYPNSSYSQSCFNSTLVSLYLGSDLVTHTSYNMASLQVPIGTSPGTAPTAQTQGIANPSNGVYT